MVENIKILDCTLRDGGYYTNWDFPDHISKTYFESINNLPVDYLEIGYRSPIMKSYFGKFYYSPSILLEKIKHLTSKDLVIILNEKDITIQSIEELLKPCIDIISMVRLAIDPQNIVSALLLAEKIKSMGFKVGFNVMYMSKWKDNTEFLKEIKYVSDLVEYFYMVDSYGGVFPSDVREIFDLIRNQTNTSIGFHGHNNLEMALINTITAIECGADIVDSTITGMGRGAGNLKTELLLTTLNSKFGLEVDFNALSEVTSVFTNLQKDYEWGTNLPYMVSGANSLPQKDVMDWVGKRYYSINSILRALNNQKEKIKDNIRLPLFNPQSSSKNVLIIGGGPSASENFESISKFISQFIGDIVIIHASSKNSLPYAILPVNHYYCLAGNEGIRLKKVFTELSNFKGTCILPPFPRKMGTYVPKAILEFTTELPEVTFTDLYSDSHTAVAIQTALNLGVKNCYFVGYDGYNSNELGDKEQELFIENETLFASAVILGINLIALTSSKYKNLVSDSVFAYI